MAEILNQNGSTTTRVHVDDTEYIIESVFGDELLEDLLADYVYGKIKDEMNQDGAAA